MIRMRKKEIINLEQCSRIDAWIRTRDLKKVRLICIERGISMSQFFREAIRKDLKNYSYLLEK